jgi:hypothetical protein
MSIDAGAVDWAAALAEVEAKIAKLQVMADGIREMMGATGATSSTGPHGGGGGGIKPNTFLKMSIPDATKKYLEMAQAKQSTQDIMDALVKGGLPPSKYNTVYSILMRRERSVGDIINMKGDWALKEWYPNHRPKKGKAADAAIDVSTEEEATA